jgi:hypothetical protein
MTRIVPGSAFLLDRPGGLLAVHARHLHVEQGDAVRVARDRRLPHPVKGRFPVGGFVDPAAQAGQDACQDRPAGLVVVHHQHPQAGQVLRLGQRRQRRARLALQRDDEPEGAPAPHRCPPRWHRPSFHQLLRDCQPETGAPSGGGRTVGLHEPGWNSLACSSWDPHPGVGDREAQPQVARRSRPGLYAQDDSPVR